MKLRYHAWMTRAANKETFSVMEHCLYAGMAISFLVVVAGVSYLAITHPSIGAFLLLVLTCAAAWRVMSQTPRSPAE